MWKVVNSSLCLFCTCTCTLFGCCALCAAPTATPQRTRAARVGGGGAGREQNRQAQLHSQERLKPEGEQVDSGLADEEVILLRGGAVQVEQSRGGK